MKSAGLAGMTVFGLLGLSFLTACQTAPKTEDRALFARSARTTTMWFENRVRGLGSQIERSGGFIVFPDVAQWGGRIGGGKFGRGAVCRPDGTQIGWASIQTGSVGVQVGAEEFKMLIVLENEPALRAFKENRLTGSVSSVAVAGKASTSNVGVFQDGVVIYQGGNAGLMAGVNVGLDQLKYEPRDRADSDYDLRY